MGVCRSFWKQVSTDGKTSSWRFMLPLSLSWDHRVIDGASPRRASTATSPVCSPTCGACVHLDATQRANHGSHRSQGAGHRRFQGRAGDRGAGQAGRHGASPKTRWSRSNRTRRRWTCRRRRPATVEEIKVKVGDKVSEGSVILTLARSGRRRRIGAAQARRGPLHAAAPPAGSNPVRCRCSRRRGSRAQAPGTGAPRHRRPAAATYCAARPTSNAKCSCSVRARRLFGGVPLRRSRHEDGAGRALRHARRRLPQRRLHSVEGAAAHRFGDGRGEDARRARHHVRRAADRLDKLRGFKDGVVKKLTGGLAGMAKMRKVEVVRGVGRFLDPHHLEVEVTSGNGQDGRGRRRW